MKKIILSVFAAMLAAGVNAQLVVDESGNVAVRLNVCSCGTESYGIYGEIGNDGSVPAIANGNIA